MKRDPPFAKIDLISWRNVMIYLTPTLQQRILPVFHYALCERGFLLLGISEGIGTFEGLTLVDAKNKLYARASVKHPLPLAIGDGGVWAPLAPAAAPRADRRGGLDEIRREADHAIVSALAPVGLIVAGDLTVVDFRGDSGSYVQPAPGPASLDLLRLVHEELRLPLRHAIEQARDTKRLARCESIPLGAAEHRRRIEVEVVPFYVGPTSTPYFAITIRGTRGAQGVAGAGAEPKAGGAPTSIEAQLAEQLVSTREHLQSAIEQLEASNEELRAANEEIASSNEELQSTNEELQTATEELQATNEELRTVNDELVDRNAESSRLAGDLTNVLSSVSIPIVLLGRDSRIRRFTPAAAKILSLIATDVGRPITDIKPKLPSVDRAQMVDEALQRLSPVERVVQGDDERWYQLAVRPYLTLDNRVDGTVVTALDIDAVKKGERGAAEARDFADGIIETMRERLVLLDEGLRVRRANRAFHAAFSTSPQDIDGQRITEVARGEWDIPALREALAALGDVLPLRKDEVATCRWTGLARSCGSARSTSR